MTSNSYPKEVQTVYKGAPFTDLRLKSYELKLKSTVVCKSDEVKLIPRHELDEIYVESVRSRVHLLCERINKLIQNTTTKLKIDIYINAITRLLTPIIQSQRTAPETYTVELLVRAETIVILLIELQNYGHGHKDAELIYSC